jgi:hypothetical protein
MLERYWPDAGQVNACIKNEAETADVAVLLAVHQPTPLVKVNEGSDIRQPVTEQDLLSAFLTDNVPSGALLLPITGASGAGKSHIIRWLDAQLRRCPQRERLHIIRIPKSASLRTVVELILAPLAEDSRYVQIRENLAHAVGEVNIKTAIVTFRAELENALNVSRVDLEEELRKHPDRRELKPLLGHAMMLPRLFTDAALDQHFLPILERVVSRAVEGRAVSEDAFEEQDGEASQFALKDLEIPRTVDLNQAAKPVRDYYLKNLAVEAARVQPAVDLLNSVVNAAIAKVFRLEENTGGVTLQDIILAVRNVLLDDDKDLVLLVEDFAALAGIQDVLLRVCIQEGSRDGKKLRATMRTALALTDGYLAFRNTILTRAQREWLVGGREQTDTQLKAGVVNMVGAYLNAARWGDEELRRLFAPRASEQSPSDWLPVWRDDALGDEGYEALGAFGFSDQGHPLFPYNRQAIEYLAERHLAQGGRLRFNPRRVINEILRAPLLMRGLFEAHEFPPGDFQSATPNMTLATWLRDTRRPEAIRARLGALLTIWGGNVSNQAAIAHVPPGIFRAFGLPTPEELANIKYEPPRAEDIRPPTGRPSPPPPVQEDDPFIEHWRKVLDRWASGVELVQKDANEIRSALIGMLRTAIDWPALRTKETDLPQRWIFIPNARGNPPGQMRLTFCDDYSDPDGSARAGLLAVIRFWYKAGRRWTYPEAADDYVASAPLIDRLAAQVTPIVLAQTKAQVGVLAQTLITQARIAGFGPPVRGENIDALLRALLAPQPNPSCIAVEENWDAIKATAFAAIGQKPARDVLQRELLNRVAAFQGERGNQPYALDITRVLEALQPNAGAEGALESLPDDIKQFIRPLGEARLWARLQPVIAKLRDFGTQIGEFIDDSFNKAQFVAELQDTMRLLGRTGTMPPNLGVGAYERRLTEFQSSPVAELLKHTSNVLSEADRQQLPRLLNNLGEMDLGLIQRTLEFLKETKVMVVTAETSVARKEASQNSVDPEKVASEIAALLERLAGGAAELASEAAE